MFLSIWLLVVGSDVAQALQRQTKEVQHSFSLELISYMHMCIWYTPAQGYLGLVVPACAVSHKVGLPAPVLGLVSETARTGCLVDGVPCGRDALWTGCLVDGMPCGRATVSY